MSRISGPLLDRIDLHVEVPAVEIEELAGKPDGEGSEAIRERVDVARGRQRRRYADESPILATAHLAEAIQYRPLDRQLWLG